MRVFRSRAEAEAAAFKPRSTHDPIWFKREGPERPGPAETSVIENALVRTDLEAQLAEALEAVEWVRDGLHAKCPACRGRKTAGHRPDCKLSLALAAFRGDGP